MEKSRLLLQVSRGAKDYKMYFYWILCKQHLEFLEQHKGRNRAKVKKVMTILEQLPNN